MKTPTLNDQIVDIFYNFSLSDKQGNRYVQEKEDYVRQMLVTAEKRKEEQILELIGYSSFDCDAGGRVSDRTCTVEDAMSQLINDIKKL